jgi:hypothetical protein
MAKPKPLVARAEKYCFGILILGTSELALSPIEILPMRSGKSIGNGPKLERFLRKSQRCDVAKVRSKHCSNCRDRNNLEPPLVGLFNKRLGDVVRATRKAVPYHHGDGSKPAQ